jgi:hypothetical protein
MLGDLERVAGVPSCAAEDQGELSLCAGTDFLGEGTQHDGHEVGVDGGEQQPDDLSADRVDEGVDVEELVAAVTDGDGPLPDGRPASAVDGGKPAAGLVGGPDLDLGARMSRCDGRYLGLKPPS